MSTVQIRDLPAAASLDGSELVELQKAAGGAGSSEQAPIGAITPPGYIDGLKMVYVGPQALTLTSGAAYIPSLGRVLRASADIAKTELSLAGSTWYHLYLFLNASAADFELSTTAPAAPYNGTARTKTGDTSRRYVGSVRTDASGALYSFVQSGPQIAYREAVTNTPFRVLGASTSTTETGVSCAAVCPPTANSASLRLINTATSGGALRTGTSDDNFAGGSTASIGFANPGNTPSTLPHPLDASQQFTYWFDAAPVGGGAYINVLGYIYER